MRTTTSPITPDIAPEIETATYRGPDRRAFGLRRETGYWRKRTIRRNIIFVTALGFAAFWLLFSIWLSLPWLNDLSELSHPLIALVVLTFIAYVPGFMNAFLLASLALRPSALKEDPKKWPGLTLLVAAYQEEALIAQTLENLAGMTYPGLLEVIVIDDGSRDETFAVAERCHHFFADKADYTLRVEKMARNSGKAQALNHALSLACVA